MAFDAPPTDLLSSACLGQSSDYHNVFDAASYEAAVDFNLKTSGGGWGAQCGLSVAASALVHSNAQTITIHFSGATTRSQQMVKPGEALSSSAAQKLAADPADFFAKYGTHFVAGYITGRVCILSYHLAFESLSSRASFQTALSDSVSELGFSDETEVSISTALKNSHTSCQIDVESYCKGFDAIAPGKKLADLDAIRKAFSDHSPDNPDQTPVMLVVMPWQYLSAVDSRAGLASSDSLIQLGKLVNRLNFIDGSCQSMQDQRSYAGATQLNMIRTLQRDAASQKAAVFEFLSQANQDGTAVTQADVDRFSDGFDLFDRLQAAAKFALSYSIECTDTVSRLVSTWKDSNGQLVPLINGAIHGQDGYLFSWSDGPRATVAQGWNYGALRHYVGFELDAENGMIRCFRTGNTNGWTPTDDLSETRKITGLSNALSCDDPNNSNRLIWTCEVHEFSFTIRVSVK